MPYDIHEHYPSHARFKHERKLDGKYENLVTHMFESELFQSALLTSVLAK